jgi:hypothetical protein
MRRQAVNNVRFRTGCSAANKSMSRQPVTSVSSSAVGTCRACIPEAVGPKREEGREGQGEGGREGQRQGEGREEERVHQALGLGRADLGMWG